MKIGERIREAVENQWTGTADELAAACEMSVSTLYYLYKKDSVDTKHLMNLSKVLNVPVSYFLGEESEKNTYPFRQVSIDSEYLKKYVEQLEKENARLDRENTFLMSIIDRAGLGKQHLSSYPTRTQRPFVAVTAP
ncbi:helix-turn-helix domain-containing protein [Tellurirhabdus rosea]|uniref:helix-turn-helix domain-containing protein n=1 Tax=Tellurirhabdus rosea TaxID=2674997 RepID=UPI00225933A4|nr:helix-turn-helix transcriptional regulator [Tellurirhabdus rosea]